MPARTAAALAVLALAAAPSARAQGSAGELLAPDLIEVKQVPGPLVPDPAAQVWAGIPAREVLLAPQRSLALHDRAANAALGAPAGAAPRAVRVQAASDGQVLALRLEWSDASEDRARPDETDRYGDAFAVQLPVRFGAGERLPYIGMGDEAQRVILHLARAAADGSVAVRTAVAAGFGSGARAEAPAVKAAMGRRAGGWEGVLLRPLAIAGNDLAKGLVPVALGVWDGGRDERGGNKALSGWRFLRMPGLPLDAAYAAELEAGRRPEDRGDLARGKQLVEGMCAACHHVGARRLARPGLAPDLSSIGAQATPGYLRESIVTPSAVVVPSPNAWQHQDRAGPKGEAGGYPYAEAFVWSRRDASGKVVSKMPPYAALPSADVDAMVTYLMTLGAPPDAGRTP
jgi:complex iron-sulfur molybdoenzyme family reductase subunit gamma